MSLQKSHTKMKNLVCCYSNNSGDSFSTMFIYILILCWGIIRIEKVSRKKAKKKLEKRALKGREHSSSSVCTI